jgi:hypothetical protein
MNFSKSLLLFLLLPVLGCGEDAVVEEAGRALYFLDNHSSHALRVEYAQQGATVPERSAAIPSGARAQFSDDSLFGGRPRPSDTFLSLALYRADAPTPSYLQQPIQDERWAEERQDTRTYGTVHYTLSIRDEDLQP